MEKLIEKLRSYADFARADECEEEAAVIMAAVKEIERGVEFKTSVACYFAEGVEFMDKTQLYDAFKVEFGRYLKAHG